MPPAAVMLYEQEKTVMKRFGIVGAGVIAAEHKKALMKRSDCIIAAVCDVVREKAEVIAEGTQARVYTDYHVMCEEVKPDAVIINLPHFLHCEATVYFLEKKTAVLVEKPMANTVSECNRMIAASEKERCSACGCASSALSSFYPRPQEDWLRRAGSALSAP